MKKKSGTTRSMLAAAALLFPWSLLVYAIAKKHGEDKALAQKRIVAGAVDEALRGRPAPSLLGSAPQHATPAQGIHQYIEHLQDCARAAADLNIIRPAAIAADITTLLRAPSEAVAALNFLAQPVDALTIQRDLNLLGAQPVLEETGEMDKATKEALKSFQERFKQQPTGELDAAAAVALKYSVGVIHFQNQQFGGGGQAA
jgi:hypothetical protein